MDSYYLNQNVNFKKNVYEKFNYWNNDVLNYLPNKNIFDDWYSLKILLSSQFSKYFSNDDIKKFLENKKDSYLISVIYCDPEKNFYDTLPCFSETLRKNESLDNASKRLVIEELFSDSKINFLTKFKYKKQKIYTYYQDISNFEIKNIYEGDDEEIKDRSRKINLLLYSNDLEKIREFTCKWRSRRHNLGTQSERLYMIDLCIFKVNDILKL